MPTIVIEEPKHYHIPLQMVFGVVMTSIILSVIGQLVYLFFFHSTNTPTIASTIAGATPVDEQTAVTAAVKAANPAVVNIIVSQTMPRQQLFGLNSSSQEVAAGSGFIVSSNGYILTNKHVASSSAEQYKAVFPSGKSYQATIAYQDPLNDIAILKIDATNLPTLQLADASTLQLGQTVIAIGNALGTYNNTVDVGVVSGLNRTVSASDQSGASSETLQGLIQTDAQINSGNSGGPLLNIAGQVIGMNTAIAQNAQGIGFAIPINQARADINQAESLKISLPVPSNTI